MGMKDDSNTHTYASTHNQPRSNQQKSSFVRSLVSNRVIHLPDLMRLSKVYQDIPVYMSPFDGLRESIKIYQYLS